MSLVIQNQQRVAVRANVNQQLQQNLLFYGLYSEIADGKMPNKFGFDWITVAGSVGSETYQLPNTSGYIAADTDYIWFKTDASQRTTTTAELIGYDFARTLVFYDNDYPYALKAIAIFKVGASITNFLRDFFNLSVWWDATLSSYGNLKGNRSSSKSTWIIETVFTKILSHFDGVDDATAYDDLVAGAFTFVGAAALKTTQKKFGTASLYCPSGALNYVSLPTSDNYNFGSGNFTIDFWFYPVLLGTGGSNHLCGQSDAAATASTRNNHVFVDVTTRKLKIEFFDNAAASMSSLVGTTVFAINNWYHVAVVRSGNTITGYVNGVPECTIDVTGKILQSVNSKFVIGNIGEYNNINTVSKGYIDEFRLSKGIARWTADFSASLPSSEYTVD